MRALATALTMTLRRRFAPLETLIEEMEKVDLSRPGLEPAALDRRGRRDRGGGADRARLPADDAAPRSRTQTRRLAALRAQEEERARVARDLHDEVNQSLTGLLLRLEAVREAAPPELEAELAETKALANQAMRELLSLARQLRPTALDDLGLAAAIAGQVELVSRCGIEAELDRGRRLLRPRRRRAAGRLPGRPGGALQRRPPLAGAERIGCGLRRDGDGVELEVADDGRGFAFDESEGGLGIAGMRERALLVGAELTIESRPGNGTTVRLRI